MSQAALAAHDTAGSTTLWIEALRLRADRITGMRTGEQAGKPGGDPAVPPSGAAGVRGGPAQGK